MAFFEDFKQGQKEFGESIAALINSALISLVYFLGVGGTSIIAKIFGKNFLELRTDEKAKTYWENLNLEPENLGESHRQF